MGLMSSANDVVIEDASVSDVPGIAALAAARRRDYEQAQPLFWKVADDDVEQHQPFLESLIGKPDVVALVARSGSGLLGYVIASLAQAPPVYAPGGPSGFIDDFAVADPSDWSTVGRDLLTAARSRVARLGATQLVVVCGHHDRPKLEALLASGLTRASEWLVAPLTSG